jgi:hypothetical protein
MKVYSVEITPITKTKMCAAKPYIVEFKTDDIDWSMEQYQRNRDPFNYEILGRTDFI